jgi:hypothetical protein
MTIPIPPPTGNDGFALGEPFDTRAALLLAHDDARKRLHAAQVDGDRDAIYAAEWTVAETGGDLLAHEHHLSQAVLMALRFAVRHFPDSLSAVLSQVPAIVELADAVAALEVKGVRA